MSKTKKIWLGILSFSPLVTVMLFISIIVLFYAKIIIWSLDGSMYERPTNLVFSSIMIYIILIMILSILMSIITYIAVIIFTICIIKNKRISDTTKIIYLIGLYFLVTIIPILYFFVEVVGKNDLQVEA